jgi:hypothetical protein
MSKCGHESHRARCLDLTGRLRESAAMQPVPVPIRVSQSVLALSPSWSNDQILVVVKTVAVLFAVGRSP